MKSIVFFTQSLGRTGSEIALFNLLKQGIPDYSIHVVTLLKGELLQKLPDTVTVHAMIDKDVAATPLQKVKSALRKRAVLRKVISLKAGVWYVNTIVFPEIIQLAKENSVPVILHVHELEHMYYNLPLPSLKTLINYPKRIIACSKAAADVLKTFGRDAEVIYPQLSQEEDEKPESISFPFNDNAQVWMMAGSTDPNKNILLFVQVANEVIKSNSNFYFVWLYSGSENGYLEYCKALISEYGIGRQVFFINPGNLYRTWIKRANGILITSHKESFSLMALEGSSMGIPVVSTDCGGVSEILAPETGTIARPASVQQLAQAIVRYHGNQIIFDRAKSKSIAERFKAGAYEKWFEIITAVR